MTYDKRRCGFCEQRFQPSASRNKHCSWQCRFLEIYRGIEPSASGCMEWPKSRQPSGYGQMNIAFEIITAHRLSWTVHRGRIPAGAHVLHKCDNRPCVNPEHLFLGNDSINQADKMAKGRYVHGKRRSGEDHPMTTLTSAQVKAIRKSSTPSRQVAAKYGVCKTTILNIRRGITWSSRGDAQKDQAMRDMLKNGGGGA